MTTVSGGHDNVRSHDSSMFADSFLQHAHTGRERTIGSPPKQKLCSAGGEAVVHSSPPSSSSTKGLLLARLLFPVRQHKVGALVGAVCTCVKTTRVPISTAARTKTLPAGPGSCTHSSM